MSELTATNHLWWSNTLEVAVHDPVMGKGFRVQFKRSTDGKLKHSGGGGYRPSEEERFEEAKRVARAYVDDELGYTILPKDVWSRTKTTRGMKYSERQELDKLTVGEKKQLAKMLGHGEIDLSEDEKQD